MPIRLALLIGFALTLIAPAGSSAPVPETCFGMAATIDDHAGEIIGTSGDDVIIGDNNRNIVHTEGGSDRVCTNGGADSIEGPTFFDESGRLWVEAPAGGLRTAATGPGVALLAEGSDGSVRNLGREPAVVYVLTLLPAGPAAGTPVATPTA